MGERKGTNKYYPPDYDPKKGGLNKFMGTHALRERARKLHLGIMIIRFEMPYNIWCEGCNNHIGMGVRYNAEKKKIGMYYSTPVYEFRMKCHLCDNHFEIKTDPANLDYVIISGARRQERRWDPTENGQVVPDDKQVIHKLADDAMFKLQHGVEDNKKLRDVTPTLSKLEDMQERWKDDYMANKALRDIFRSRKRELQDQQNKDNEFLKKRSLDIPLLQESEDDAKVASLIRLQPAQSVDERQLEKRSEIEKRSQFPFPLTTSGASPATKQNTTNEADDAQEGRASKTSYPQSLLEQRRLSLGIKLKSSTQDMATSSTATVSKNNMSSNEDTPDQAVDETLKGKQLVASSTVTSQMYKSKDDTPSQHSLKTGDKGDAIKINNDPIAIVPDSSKSIITQHHNKDDSRKTQPSSFSALVSYSDDSEQNSAASGSDTE